MRIKSKLATLALAAVVASGYGCAIGKPQRNPDELYVAKTIRWGIESGYSDIDIGKKIQTTPVHPHDGGASQGKATTDINSSGIGGLVFGLEASLGTDDIRAKIGSDIRLNAAHFGGYRGGIYEVERQTSGKGSESYAYTELKPDIFTYIPFVGVEKKISKDWSMVAEFGIPLQGNRVNSGHDRYGEWERVQTSYRRGFGKSMNLGFKNIEKDQFPSFFLRYETVSPSFAGERGRIDSFSVLCCYEWEF